MLCYSNEGLLLTHAHYDSRNASVIVCETPPVDVDMIGLPLYIEIIKGGAVSSITISGRFTYRANPSVQDIFPLTTLAE